MKKIVDFIMEDILHFSVLLESAVNNPFQTFGGEDLYLTIFDKAAQLAYGFVKNHGFVDGNKRVAVHAMEVYLELNDYEMNFSQEEIVKIGIDLAEDKLSVEDLSKMLERKTVLNLIEFFET